jgi:hypothetical protein
MHALLPAKFAAHLAHTITASTALLHAADQARQRYPSHITFHFGSACAGAR